MKRTILLIASGTLVGICICMAIVIAYPTKKAPTPTIAPTSMATRAEAQPTATNVLASATAPAPTNTPQPAPTRTPAPLPTSTQLPAPTNMPRPMPTATPVPTRIPPTPTIAGAFTDGTKIVGTDIQPGTYRSMGASGCYWERMSGFGGTLGEIIANGNPAGPAIVTIAATDKGFKSQRCGTWTPATTAITASPTAPFGAGTFMVGKDIAAGTWRSDGTGSCYWERVKGFSGQFGDIIANANVTGGTVVEISAGDAGFTSARCGTWTKIN